MHIFLFLLSSYTNVAHSIILFSTFFFSYNYVSQRLLHSRSQTSSSFFSHLPNGPLCGCSTLFYQNHISSVQSLSRAQLFSTPWTAACQASLSITNFGSLLKLMSIESAMPSNHLILCRPLLLLPSNFPSIRVFSNELVLHIRWPKYWSFSFSISPSNGHSGLISFGLTGWISLQSKGLSRVSNITVQKHQFFAAQLFLWSNSHIHT